MSHPKKCNHCCSDKVSKQIWGRVEYYYCSDCKKEVVEAKQEDPISYSPWTSWDPKQYGFVNSGQSKTYDDHFVITDDTMDTGYTISLPPGTTINKGKPF